MNKLEETYDHFSRYNKIFDTDAIVEIVRYLIISNKLNEYLYQIKFHEQSDIIAENSFCCASVDQNNRLMNINIKDIEQDIKLNTERYSHLFKKEELIYFQNSVILHSLLHEIEHVLQVKNMDDGSLESNIVKWSTAITVPEEDIKSKKMTMEDIKKAIAKKQMLYNLNYPLCPVERWAELNSFGKLIELNKHLNNIQGINEVYKFLSVYQQIKGYKKIDERIISPTLRYLLNLGYEKELQTLSWFKGDNAETDMSCMKTFSYDDRIYFGFPLHSIEVRDKCLEFKCDQKRLIK